MPLFGMTLKKYQVNFMIVSDTNGVGTFIFDEAYNLDADVCPEGYDVK